MAHRAEGKQTEPGSPEVSGQHVRGIKGMFAKGTSQAWMGAAWPDLALCQQLMAEVRKQQPTKKVRRDWLSPPRHMNAREPGYAMRMMERMLGKPWTLQAMTMTGLSPGQQLLDMLHPGADLHYLTTRSL